MLKLLYWSPTPTLKFNLQGQIKSTSRKILLVINERHPSSDNVMKWQICKVGNPQYKYKTVIQSAKKFMNNIIIQCVSYQFHYIDTIFKPQ